MVTTKTGHTCTHTLLDKPWASSEDLYMTYDEGTLILKLGYQDIIKTTFWAISYCLSFSLDFK